MHYCRLSNLTKLEKKKKKGKKPLLVKCFCRAILYYSQSGDDSQEDLAKFEYKRNKKLQFWKAFLHIFGDPLKPCYVNLAVVFKFWSNFLPKFLENKTFKFAKF
jgi:hypothetical protein